MSWRADGRAVLECARLPDHCLNEWDEWCVDERFADNLKYLVRNHPEELIDSFRRVLPMGTGGRRGTIGPGCNRLNWRTLTDVVRAHAFSLQPGSTVAVAYDARVFSDLRGILGPKEGPLHGLRSVDFARHAAEVYASFGINALVASPSRPWVTTPELSFAIRKYALAGGLMVTASHNPPDDNGAKIYNSRGYQLVPPEDEELFTAPLREVCRTGSIEELPDVFEDWRSDIGEVPSVSVLYTPLHGIGRLHDAFGWPSIQNTVDGTFPSLKGGSPNPERASAFDVAMAHAVTALIFATDPDADRLGVAVHHDGDWVVPTGHQLAALMVDQVLRDWSDPRQPVVITTIVTSRLISKIAAHYGARCIDELPVGFKFIAHEAERLPVTQRFAIGVEESLGTLTGDAMREKDAACGARLIALASARAGSNGGSVVDLLIELEHAFGQVSHRQIRITHPDGAAVMGELRKSDPASIGSFAVRSWWDQRTTSTEVASDQRARDLLVVHVTHSMLSGDGRLLIRPSGTEPLIKVYLEWSGPESECALDELEQASRLLVSLPLIEKSEQWQQ